MGYSEAIEANGVKIKTYKEFGSYQGTFIAVLEDGRFIEGSYGSCSGCDAYEAEFGYADRPEEVDGKYYKRASWDQSSVCSIEEYEQALAEYEEKHRRFGQSYVDAAESKEEILARYEVKCTGDYAWHDDKEILEWIRLQD